MESNRLPQPLPFLSYTPESLLAATDRLIAISSEVWDQIAQISPSEATFANTIQPIVEEENERLNKSRILQFLSGSSTSEDLRDASKQAAIRLSQDLIQRHSRDDVFTVVNAVSSRPDVKDLPLESQVYLRKLKQEFIANGLGLDSESRSHLKSMKLRLVSLLKQYTANLNGESGGIWLSRHELDGLAASTLERFKIRDEDEKLWVTFKAPDRFALNRQVHSAAVRQHYLQAWEGRLAQENGPIQEEILQLRRKTAQILGYKTFAESEDINRMMSTKDAAEFISDIATPLTDIWQQDLSKLSELKEAHLKTLSPADMETGSPTEKALFRWDLSYYMNKKAQKAFGLNPEIISEYYPFQKILPKIFDIFSLLLGIRLVILDPATEGISIWHESVMVMSAWDEKGKLEEREFMGYMYIDPYPRPGKYGHVGHTGLQPGFLKKDGTRHYPVSCLMLNYAPPTTNRPSLLRFGGVVQLFHEIGHSIHWLACRSMYARFHQNTARDFVEVPSKMLEHFFYNRNIIRAVSSHYETGSQIPEELIDWLVSSRYENISINYINDLVFAMFDMNVHTDWQPNEAEPNASVLFDKIRRQINLLHGPEDLGMGFGSVLSATRLRLIDGYAASYYSYLLADTISTDIFQSKFESLLSLNKNDSWSEIINDNLRAEGRRYRHAILEPGSSTGSELELIKSYLGRSPDLKALVNVIRNG